MKTKIFTAGIMLAAISFGGCMEDVFMPCITGNNNFESESRALADFNKIDYQIEGNLIVRKASENRIEIEGSSNQLNYIKTKVENGRLKIYSSQCLKNTDLNFVVYTEDLSEVKLAGSGDVEVMDDFASKELNFEVSGSGKLSAPAEAELVTTKLSGSGSITLEGYCQNFESQISGSGKIHGYALVANSANATISGSGDLEIFVNSTLTSNISGSGSVRYKGNPPIVNSNISGSGRVTKVQ